MWANAQIRDVRPAKHRWRPLFNAAVWLTSTTKVPCSNAAKTRKPLKFAGVPQTRQQTSAISRPKLYYEDLWMRYQCLTSFSNCRYMPQLRRHSPTKLCDGAKMANFCILYFSESRAAHFRHAF